MKKYALIIVLIFLLSCSKKENIRNDKVVLEYKYNLNKKEYFLIFSNNTNEDLTLLIPNQLVFVLNSEGLEKLSSDELNNTAQAIFFNIKNYPVTKSSALLKKSYLDYFHKNDPKYEFTALDLKSQEKKEITYSLQADKNNKLDRKSPYIQYIPKMRDLLNQKPFVGVINQYLEFNHDYKLYLEDFEVKDSLIIKF